MKLKFLRTFENFDEQDFGRFNDDEDTNLGSDYNEDDFDNEDQFDDEDDDCNTCGHDDDEFSNELEDDDHYGQEDQDEEDEEATRIRRWGDEEIVEKKKMNAGFKAYLDKQKAKSKSKKGGKGKPDFLDLDKDGDKKESMIKAAKEKAEKAIKEDEKGKKGLTAAQKRLPDALQKAILKKQNKK
jgi:hypothetical protein